jgi:hypothetical protein
MLKQKNSKKQGDVGLGIAIAYFTTQGYTVSIPLTDSQAYDLLVDDGVIRRVQVKTTTQKNEYGSYLVEMRTLGGNQSFNYVKKFDPTAVDWIFIVTAEGQKYLIPVEGFTGRSSITVGKQYKEFEIGLVV